MQQRFIDLHCDDSLLCVGLAPLAPDFHAGQLERRVPAATLLPCLTQPRWRFLDHPVRDCEGALILTPPRGQDTTPPRGWAVLRRGRALYKMEWSPGAPIAEINECLANGKDRQIWKMIGETCRITLDMGRARIADRLERHALNHADALPGGSDIQIIARERESNLIMIARQIMLDLLDSDAVAALGEDLTPGLYNWLIQAGPPDFYRRQGAFQADPGLVREIVWTDRMDYLDMLLAQETHIEVALAEFRRTTRDGAR